MENTNLHGAGLPASLSSESPNQDFFFFNQMRVESQVMAGNSLPPGPPPARNGRQVAAPGGTPLIIGFGWGCKGGKERDVEG